jgi:hypothetical protein
MADTITRASASFSLLGTGRRTVTGQPTLTQVISGKQSISWTGGTGANKADRFFRQILSVTSAGSGTNLDMTALTDLFKGGATITDVVKATSITIWNRSSVAITVTPGNDSNFATDPFLLCGSGADFTFVLAANDFIQINRSDATAITVSASSQFLNFLAASGTANTVWVLGLGRSA